MLLPIQIQLKPVRIFATEYPSWNLIGDTKNWPVDQCFGSRIYYNANLNLGPSHAAQAQLNPDPPIPGGNKLNKTNFTKKISTKSFANGMENLKNNNKMFYIIFLNPYLSYFCSFSSVFSVETGFISAFLPPGFES